MSVHELKTWPEYFVPITEGRKNFEYRKNDRGFEVGDILLLREYEPDGMGRYTGRFVERHVTFVLLGPLMGVPPGYAILSIAKREP